MTDPPPDPPPDPAGQPPPSAPPPSGPEPPASGGHGWMIAGAVVLALVLGALVAGVLNRGDSGAEANTAPAGVTVNVSPSTRVEQSTVTKAVPSPTVTVEHSVTVEPPAVSTPARTATARAPATTVTSP